MRQHMIRLAGHILALALAISFAQGALAQGPIVRVSRVPEGGVQPQAATDGAGVVHLVYFKGEPMHGDVYYARSADDGATFSEPIRVNSQPGSVVATGTVRGAHLAVGKGGRVHVAWMGSDKAEPKIAGRHTPMLYTRLNDAGDGFEPQRNLIQNYPGLDGGGSVAADAEGNVYVAWHAPRKEQSEKDRHVWVVRSEDEGRTFGPEVMADPAPLGVCACCGMRIVAGPVRGEVSILYRSASTMVDRDIQFLASADHGRTFKAVATDPWKVGQCVMSTAAFARDGGRLVAAWETERRIRIATLDADPASAEPVTLTAPGEGENRKHPAVATNRAGQFVVAWTEGTGWNKGGVVRWQMFDNDGTPMGGESGRSEGLPAWSVPAAIAVRDGSFRIIY